MKRFLFLFAILSVCLAACAQCTSDRYTRPVFSTVTTTTGIRFGSATAYLGLSPQSLYLDIYEPAGDTLSQRPLIVYAFGGGFLVGTRNQPPIPAYASYLSQCGYVVASIDYRTGFDVADGNSATRAVYRGVQDLRGAVRFFCQRYPQYRIDTQAIFLTGSSAGCFSGLHSCFMEQSDAPSAVHGIFSEPSDLGCLDCADNTDNNSRMPKIRGIISHWGAILDTNFIRATAKDNVPTICLQGDQDMIVPYTSGPPFSVPIFPNVEGSLPIHKRLDNLGIKNVLHTFVGYGHEPWLTAPALVDTCRAYEIPFLYSILKPKPLSIAGDSIICAGSIGTYTVAASPGSHYCWSAGLGGAILSSNNSEITVQWVNAGNHIVTVREMTRNEVNGDIDSFQVIVINRAVAGFGDSVLHTLATFTDSSQWATSWQYEFGDNSSAATADPAHTYSEQGMYTAQQIVSNGYCADTAYRVINTDTCPSGAAITYVVAGDTVYFNAAPQGAAVYTWHFGDGDSATGNAPVHIYTHSQNYLVSISAITTNQCNVYTSVIMPFSAFSTATGITDVGAEVVHVYPIPADDALHIATLHQAVDITLYDLAGQAVSSRHADAASDVTINMDGIVPGIYILKISAKNWTKNIKVARR